MKRKCTLEQRAERTAYITLIPLLIVLFVVRGVPMVMAFIKSFYNWDGGIVNEWVGLNNYIKLFKNKELGTMIGNNLFLLLHIPLQIIPAFIFAMLIYEKVPGWKIFRSLYYLPQVTSIVVIGTLFRTLFRASGPVNGLLEQIGLEFLTRDWLGNRFSALTVIMIAMIWQSLGWQILIFSGGLSSMDVSVIEAATVDGANYWQRLFRVILPLQIRSIEYSVVVSIIWVFSGLYTFIYTITDGGPGYSTTTLDYMIYLKAFCTSGQLGMACACAVVLLVVVLVLVGVQRKLTDKAGEWQ